MADLFGPTFRGELHDLMQGFYKGASSLSNAECQDRLTAHAATLAEVAARNPNVNIELAEGILRTLATALNKPTNELQSSWIRAAALYFMSSQDQRPDFESLTGFDDDAEVLNLCLDFCGLDDLKINKEDF